MSKRRTTADLIIEMSKLGDRLGHPPKLSEVAAESKQGHIASTATYLRLLGHDVKTNKNSWKTVLEACGMEMPQDRHGRGHKLDPKEQARRNKIAQDKKKKRAALRDARAREKRLAKIQSEKAKAAKQASQSAAKDPTATVPAQITITGRTEMADELKLINLTGYTLALMRRGRREYIPSSGKITFFADSYKYLGDTIIGKEIRELFGNVGMQRIHTPYCVVDTKNERRQLPKPHPGTYYLLSRRDAELIASTGRSMEDFVIPIVYRTKSGILYVDGIGMKLSSK